MADIPKKFWIYFQIKTSIFSFEILDVTGEDLIETRSIENGFHDCRINLIGLGVNFNFFHPSRSILYDIVILTSTFPQGCTSAWQVY